MNFKSDMLSVTQVNKNFPFLEKLVSEKGSVVICKRNKPKYMFVDLDKSPVIEMTDDEKIDFVAKRILKKYKSAFEELAK